MKVIKPLLSIFMLTLVLLCAVQGAKAATLRLPAGIKTIEAEAFYGDTSLDEVVLPEGIESIEDRAFSGSSLHSINQPS